MTGQLSGSGNFCVCSDLEGWRKIYFDFFSWVDWKSLPLSLFTFSVSSSHAKVFRVRKIYFEKYVCVFFRVNSNENASKWFNINWKYYLITLSVFWSLKSVFNPNININLVKKCGICLAFYSNSNIFLEETLRFLKPISLHIFVKAKNICVLV